MLEIKEMIKNIDWYAISLDWSVSYKKCTKCKIKYIELDPFQDCSDDNPLYLKKEWLEYLYINLELSDRNISEICGVSHGTITNWRNKHIIQGRTHESRYLDPDGYWVVRMPQSYRHPQIQLREGRQSIVRKEHAIVMEDYLRNHPKLEISRRLLINGRYLNVNTHVHHINFNKTDNRIGNLFPFRDNTSHGLCLQSLIISLSSLIKLEQILFSNGRYYSNSVFDYRSLDPIRISEIIKPLEFIDYTDVERVKKAIKEIDWLAISDDWTIPWGANQYGNKGLLLNPYEDCSKFNPLHRHKKWMETILRDKRFNLSDARLAEICNMSESGIYKYRWINHRIPQRDQKFGQPRRLDPSGRIRIKVPNDYNNPFLYHKERRYGEMYEHRYIMEKYLSKNPQLDISKSCLIDSKYLNPDCRVHHINLDKLDNRLENLWVFESSHGHQNLAHKSLYDLVELLIEESMLFFKKGKYDIHR